MLKIDSNQVIKMSRGDDVKFPLFLNRGTLTAPVRYVFEENKGCEVYFYIWDYSEVEEHPWDHVDIYGYDPDTSNEYQDPFINQIIFSKYKIKKRLGKGTFGSIYLVEHNNKLYAMKLENTKKRLLYIRKRSKYYEYIIRASYSLC
jgi:hypothetical protein